MKKKRIAVNGCGRIGRLTIKLILDSPDLELVAVNDLTDPKTLAHLLQYDSIHGKYGQRIVEKGGNIHIGDKVIRIFAEKNPLLIPWKDLNIDVVFESTGKFTDRSGAEMHLRAGAKKVIITAPPKSQDVPMVVLGVNEAILKGDEDIVSNASCTTNCLAPMVKVLDQAFGIVKGYVSTVHSYTNDQNLHDAPHRDLRRARAAAYSIIPTSTHAAKAMEIVLPELKGKIEASAMRVPVPDGSLTDLIVLLKQETSAASINQAFLEASQNRFKGIIEYAEDPLVSIDIVGNPHSCILDSGLTSSMGNLVKVVGWYDNESGYSNRLVELASRL
ncbi:type I glyceraldehyde-3-phosphate dehydrogenase [Cyclobacterium sp.]|uniref:type I glyceraldehyde-3-phosphate dehydrogenase n=1 Tax=Cyclobacterium sp. TaxID=1966343 RepID=UPI00198747B1|nr:type I glyceraldehyde-3-phosphate dehydrogenase [Cyclobacterium sp.]MBD3626858.1 type I glyceraldehyde-3-phosphate dehydrogenase [Cyclobacterium sp.]